MPTCRGSGIVAHVFHPVMGVAVLIEDVLGVEALDFLIVDLKSGPLVLSRSIGRNATAACSSDTRCWPETISWLTYWYAATKAMTGASNKT